jgi:hypothetical protein
MRSALRILDTPCHIGQIYELRTAHGIQDKVPGWDLALESSRQHTLAHLPAPVRCICGAGDICVRNAGTPGSSSDLQPSERQRAIVAVQRQGRGWDTTARPPPRFFPPHGRGWRRAPRPPDRVCERGIEPGRSRSGFCRGGTVGPGGLPPATPARRQAGSAACAVRHRRPPGLHAYAAVWASPPLAVVHAVYPAPPSEDARPEAGDARGAAMRRAVTTCFSGADRCARGPTM